MPLTVGAVLINRYRIVNLLGKGGFGAVYRAWDINLNRPCALKENLDTSAEAQRQFSREAIVLANLSHPNLPRVTDHFILPEQGQYLVMDFVEGEDLGSLVARQGRVSPQQALAWIGQVTDALEYLHRQKPPVLHRDIKPANIRVTPDGRAMLVDFGLVKIFDPQLRTTVGARAVTPGYSPPEQYGAGNTDVRTDIYALGATLYTLLTGQEPPESVQRMTGGTLPLVHRVNPAVTPEISRAIQRAMALTPSQRYQSAEEFKADLKTVRATPRPAPSRRLWIFIPVLLLLGTGLALGIGYAWSGLSNSLGAQENTLIPTASSTHTSTQPPAPSPTSTAVPEIETPAAPAAAPPRATSTTRPIQNLAAPTESPAPTATWTQSPTATGTSTASPTLRPSGTPRQIQATATATRKATARPAEEEQPTKPPAPKPPTATEEPPPPPPTDEPPPPPTDEPPTEEPPPPPPP